MLQPRQLLDDVDDGDRRARPLGGLHVVRQFFDGVEGLCALHAVRLERIGDDDQLAGAKKLLVQFIVGDVVRVLLKQERCPGSHVADLQRPAPDREPKE